MITEDYVSFKTAKLLKEKGFDENGVKLWYDESGEMYYGCHEIKYQIKIENHEKFFQCPTLQMVMKWLREVHNITIGITFSYGIISYEIQKNDEFITSVGSSRTYEQMSEEAIRYCLENLI